MLGLALYVLRIFAIGAGYHRYFAHRAFRTSRAFQFVLAFLSLTSAQRGILWWVAKHRQHHMHADTEADLHSPVLHGFFYAHVGWIFEARNDPTDRALVSDLSQYKELLWLERHSYLPVVTLTLLTWLIAGWPGVIVGFCWSTVAVWHVTFSVNSLSHLIGRRPYITGDRSGNNWLLALLTMGEGWHNNHHAYQASVRQGFRWWEYDPTFYILRVLSWFGLVWDLHVPPEAIVRGEHKLGRRVINKVAGQLAASYPIDPVASQTLEALSRAPSWPALKARILSANVPKEAFWGEIDLPPIPTLEEVRCYARGQLAQTTSLDEIALSTRQRLRELVYSQLSVSGGNLFFIEDYMPDRMAGVVKWPWSARRCRSQVLHQSTRSAIHSWSDAIRQSVRLRPSPIGHQIGHLWYARSMVIEGKREETPMPKPVLTLAAAWATFDAMAFDGGVTSVSRTQARRVFYAGAQSILDILMAGPQATESEVDHVEALSDELRRFGEEVEAGRA
jgi:stearoyl-CoA desaturase (Delta-9 desaturase)